jgi:fatty acid desaturase
VSYSPPGRRQSLPKNEVPARGPGLHYYLKKELGSATLTVAILILFVGLVLTALFLLVLAGLTLSLLSGLTAVLALVTLLTFLVHIVCHKTFS